MSSRSPTIHLILGCFGLSEDNFVSCKAIENTILSISPSLPLYTEMMDFLDQYGLFDRPNLDSNGIRNFLSLFRDKFNRMDQRLWSESKIIQIQKFIQNHKLCGLYLKLSFEEKKSSIEIKSIEINPSISSNNFKIQKIRMLKGK